MTRYVLPNRDAAHGHICERLPFRISGANMSGATEVGHFGSLPEPYRAELVSRRGDVAYVVHSYSTPIAWAYRDGEIIVPRVTYSTTTARHQSIARSALGVPWQLDRHRPGATYSATAMPKGARRPELRRTVATGVAGTSQAVWEAEHALPTMSRFVWTEEA